MKKSHFTVILLTLVAATLGIFFALRSEHALLVHPKGEIARRELHLMATNVLLMLSIIVPTLILLFLVVWKQVTKRHDDKKGSPNTRHPIFREGILWIIPLIVVLVMGVITWFAAHKLDPYRPLQSKRTPLHIQVVALDWKWLFIYPQQGIATLNFIEIPENIPVRFSLSADGSPMNSFWIPQLSGQIYAMSGMITTLHIMANEQGEYTGRAAEINGAGFADMTFAVKVTSESDFMDWINSVKSSPHELTGTVYSELIKPSMKNQITFYSSVKKDLFEQMVEKYLKPSS